MEPRPFPCDNLEHATDVLARLAKRAEEERQKDGAQRYFCLAGDTAETAADAPPEGVPHEEGLADTLVVFVAQYGVQWIATDRADVRVIVCNADRFTHDAPAECSSPQRRTLADLPWEVRQVIAECEAATTLFVHPAPPIGSASEENAGGERKGGGAMSGKYVKGVTLSPRERRDAGLLPRTQPGEASSVAGGSGNGGGEVSPTGIVRAHSGPVILPNGETCAVSYTRFHAGSHRFLYGPPLREAVWIAGALDGGTFAIEARARELAGKAFRQAQEAEQRTMRRTAPPRNTGTNEETGSAPLLPAREAVRCAGWYCACLRFVSGSLMQIGALYPTPEGADREIRAGRHDGYRRDNGATLVVGVCCRWARRFVPARLVASPDREEAEPPLRGSGENAADAP